MSFEPLYYTAYEEEEDELTDSQGESSSEDEIEKDVAKFFSKKAIKVSKNELADEFEKEMNAELDQIVEQKRQAYFEKPAQMGAEKVEPCKEVEVKEVGKKLRDMDINYEIEDTDSEEEMATGERCFKKKQQFTNDELLYDPEMDEADQNWINKQRETSEKIVSPKQPITSFSSEEASKVSPVVFKPANSDAVLNCPCCMTLLTMDCQRHEKFRTQYRAMFVFNCRINLDEQLKYARNENNKRKFKKYKKKKQEATEEEDKMENQLTAMSTQEEYDDYRPVSCVECNSNVGVHDEKEEIYYFFNVLASHT